MVNGLGGIGKTEVCRRYFRQNRNNFSHLAWIDYQDSLKASFYNNFPDRPAQENEAIDDHFRHIIHFLANLGEDVLIIIDNIDNPDDPDLHHIRALPGKILVNSRLRITGFTEYPLGFLPPDKCRDLFMEHYNGKPDPTALDAIITLAGRHTLTIELLARTARNAGLSVAELHDKLNSIGFNLNEAILG